MAIGEVLEDDALRGLVERIVDETVAIARKLGVERPADIAEAAIRKGRGFPYETKTSFQRDFEIAYKRGERELFAGAVLNYGKELGVATPATAEMAAIVETVKPVSR